jgi:hypothetical protein
MLVYTSNFLQALLFTIIIEAIVILLLCYLLKKDFRISIVSVLGNICTVPYVWFVFPAIFWYSSNLIVVSGESAAFLFEAVLYKFLGKLSWKMAFLFSLLANVASFFLGKFLL